MAWTRDEMVARELRDGYYVRLHIGIPTQVANHIPAGMNVTRRSKNGLSRMGSLACESEADPDLINAGKQTITARAIASF